MKPRVAILDYGCGNLASVANAVRKVGGEPFIWLGCDRPDKGTHLILPGQGHFATAAANIHAQLWDRPPSFPVLGICLGMQLMCEGSEEAPGVKGLGWLPYPVRRLQVARLPHIGWNTVHWEDGRLPGDFYFCHSYAAPGFVCDDDGLHPPRDYGWGTFYEEGKGFMAAARRGNLWAVQFHPEKSGKAGLALLAEFLKL